MAEVRLEVDLAHPPEAVWRALTSARLLSSWFMPTDLEPREGHRFTLDPGTLAGFLGLVSGEVRELVAGQRLVMLWQGEKLHTRVVWELTGTAAGCRVQVVQTGFIGAPAALRRRALRDTYLRLFGEQLPAVLARTAGGTGDLTSLGGGQRSGPGVPMQLRSAAPAGSGPAGRPPTGPALPGAGRGGVPRQRRGGGNMAVAAWSAGRTIAAASPSTAAPAAAPASGSPLAGPGPAGAPPGPEAGSGAAPPGSRWRVVPAWVRAVAIGAAAAVLALAVLTAVSQSSRGSGGLGGLPGGPDPPPGGPGVALRPGASTSHAGPDGPSAPGTPGAGVIGTRPGTAPDGRPSGGPPEQSGGATLPPAAGAGQDESEPARPPEGTPASGASAPVLTARVVTSGLPALGGRAVAVTVANPGPGTATGWVVRMDVADQTVTEVSGAAYQPDGSEAIFTPLAADLPDGEDVVFSFHLTPPVLGLLGATDPTGCTVDGRPCQ